MFLFPKDSYLELIHHGTKSAQKQIQEIIQVDLEMCPGWRGITNMAFKQRFIRAYIAVKSVYFIRWPRNPNQRPLFARIESWVRGLNPENQNLLGWNAKHVTNQHLSQENSLRTPPVAAHHRGRSRGRSPCHRNWNRPFCWPTRKGIGHQTQHHFLVKYRGPSSISICQMTCIFLKVKHIPW